MKAEICEDRKQIAHTKLESTKGTENPYCPMHVFGRAKGHTLGKAVHLPDGCLHRRNGAGGSETGSRGADGPQGAPQQPGSHNFLNRQQVDRVYPDPAGRDEQVALIDMVRDPGADTRPMEDRFLVCNTTDSTLSGKFSAYAKLNEVSKRGSSADEKGTREQRRDMIKGSMQDTCMCERITRSPTPLKDFKDSCKSSEADNNMQGGQQQQ